MRIDLIFLTHAHLDHIAFLPFIVDSVGDYRRAPITVHGAPETLRILRSHVFNWLIWPDFSAIPDRSRPLIRFNEIHVGEVRELAGRRITALPALHAVPAIGYQFQGSEGSLAFTGDTTVSANLNAALKVLRTRLTMSGTTMGFSTEASDELWWLMISGDQNCLRAIISLMPYKAWQPDIPRLVRGALNRLQGGHCCVQSRDYQP